MSRISAKLIRDARRISPFLPRLLPANRTIEQASLELKWIKQELPKEDWNDAVNQRYQLVPLQYILGSQPFGELNIKCTQGVLIPRWETQKWCNKLVETLKQTHVKQLVVLDACTGTGCIPLLIGHELNNIAPKIYGLDVSGKAFDLANENLSLYKQRYPNNPIDLKFYLGDVFDAEIMDKLGLPKINLLTSNPPYIPYHDYIKSIGRDGVAKSVKLYEPSLALLGDGEFYRSLVQNILRPSQAEAFVFEIGYKNQADYVNFLLEDDSAWSIGVMKDSSNHIRCVLGWLNGSDFDGLKTLCDDVYVR